MTALRVLIVEDDAMIGQLLAETLVELGYEVCGVEATEAGAVSAAARHRPDLMIVDVNLAGGSGLAAMACIARVAAVPHFFISGHTRQADMPGGVLLTKPFPVADLVKAIERAVATTALSA